MKYLFRCIDNSPAFILNLPKNFIFTANPFSKAYASFKSIENNNTLIITHQKNISIQHTGHILKMAKDYVLKISGRPIETYGYCSYLGGNNNPVWLPIDPLKGPPFPIALEFGYMGEEISGFKVVFLLPKKFEWTFTLNGLLTHRDVAELQDILKSIRPVNENDIKDRSIIEISSRDKTSPFSFFNVLMSIILFLGG